MESVLTYKHKKKNQIVEIVYDEYISSEYVREGSMGKMLCSHRNYNLGDIQIKTQDEFDEYLKVKHFKMPLYLLDHSGLSMRTTKFFEDPQGWDSGMIGYIYITHDEIRKEYNVKKITSKILKKVESIFIAEVKEYSLYLEGSVYGYQLYNVKNCDLEHEHKEIVDSCYGFVCESYNEMLENVIIHIGGQESDWIEESK